MHTHYVLHELNGHFHGWPFFAGSLGLGFHYCSSLQTLPENCLMLVPLGFVALEVLLNCAICYEQAVDAPALFASSSYVVFIAPARST